MLFNAQAFMHLAPIKPGLGKANVMQNDIWFPYVLGHALAPMRRLETRDLALESADVSDSQVLNKAFPVGSSMLLAL